MASRREATAELLAAVPSGVRARVLSGFAWSAWLSLFAAPFSYGTSILLARVGPEALGTYGLLTVYVGTVSALLYVGGDAVAIRFLPELRREDRISFLLSYAVVIGGCVLAGVAAAAVWPSALRYVLGQTSDPGFRFLLVCLAPVSIVLALALAALKGLLEMAYAQVLLRTVTIGSFLVYAVLFWLARGFLAAHYAWLVWVVYFGLAAVAAGLGIRRLLALDGIARVRRPRFVLPRGFWQFTFALQQVSILAFFLRQLDYLLVLNFGGLVLLGKYAAVMTVALVVQLGGTLLLDTLLPSLTTLKARENWAGMAQVTAMHLRILFAVTTAATCALMLLAPAITSLLGAPYEPLRPQLVFAILLVGLAAPGAIGGLLLTSVGKQQRCVPVSVFQLVLYVALFALLWPAGQLSGAVWAYGISLLAANLLLLAVAERNVPFQVKAAGDYARFALVCVAVAAAALRLPDMGVASGIGVWLAAVLAFLFLAGYRPAECAGLAGCFTAWRARPARSSAPAVQEQA